MMNNQLIFILLSLILLFSKCGREADGAISVPAKSLSISTSPTTNPYFRNNLEADNNIRQVISGGRTITFTNSDLIAQRENKNEFSLSAYAKRISVNRIPASECRVLFTFKPLSLVAGIISVEQTAIFDNCGNGNINVNWLSIDLRKPGEVQYSFAKGVDTKSGGKLALLSDYFSEAVIVRELLKVPEIEAEARDLSAKPNKIPDLVEVVKNVGLGRTATDQLRMESFYGFVFQRVDGKNVIVRIPLVPLGHSADIEYLEVALPLSESNIKDSFERLDNNGEGFMNQDGSSVFNREIEISSR